MIITLNCKDLETFLNAETNETILSCKYIIASYRIHIKDRSNCYDIINGSSLLYPSTFVLMGATSKEQESAYYEMLDESKSFIANIIKLSIKKGYDIIILATSKEVKYANFLKWFRKYVWKTFKYPVSDYRKKDIEYVYDPLEVLDICKSIIDSEHIGYNIYQNLLRNGYSIKFKEFKRKFKNCKTKELKFIYDKFNYYYDKSYDKKDLISCLYDEYIEFIEE